MSDQREFIGKNSGFNTVLEETMRSNSERGDKFWGKYGERLTIVEEYHDNFSPILHGETIESLAQKKNDRGNRVFVELFGNGDIARHFQTDSVVACTLEDLRSLFEKIKDLQRKIQIVPGDLNKQETYRQIKEKLKEKGTASLLVCLPLAGESGIPNGSEEEFLKHREWMIEQADELVAPGGTILMQMALHPRHVDALWNWLSDVFVSRGDEVELEQNFKPEFSSPETWYLRINKKPKDQ